MPKDLFCKFCPELGNTIPEKKKKANSQRTRAILSIWISRVWSYSCWLLGTSYFTQRNRGLRNSSPAQVGAGPQTLQFADLWVYAQLHKVKSIKPKPFPWQLYLFHDSLLSSQWPHSERTPQGSYLPVPAPTWGRLGIQRAGPGLQQWQRSKCAEKCAWFFGTA